MTALRVCDIDLARRIDVRRAYSDVGGTLVLGTPKSHHSRVVPLPRFLAAALSGHLQGKQPDTLAFATRSSAPLRLSNWRRSVFRPARAAAKISDRFRVHDCGTPPPL